MYVARVYSLPSLNLLGIFFVKNEKAPLERSGD